MPTLSAFIIVKNEARDIGACLDSLKGLADEIVVVDDCSSDTTVNICRAKGARVLTRELDGFGPQKQYALDQTTGDWAFSIDADERATPELAKAIRRVMTDVEAANGYVVRRDMFFLGHRLRYGGVGNDAVLRLFKRRKGRMKLVKVHEGIEVDGEIRRLNASLEHYSYASIEEYQQKCDYYTTLAAQELWAKGHRFSVFNHLRPVWEIFSRVLLRGAWLDGQAGLVYAALSGHSAWLRSIKLWEIGQRAGE